MAYTKKSFVELFEEKTLDKSKSMKDLLQELGDPIDPSCDPEQYEKCLDLLKKNRPEHATGIDEWLDGWQEHFCNIG